MRWIGWFFILLGIILLAGFGVAAGFLEGDLPLLAKVAGGSGAALVVIGLYGQREFFAQLSEDQTTGRSVNAIVATVLAGAILVVANVAAHDAKWRWDATKNKQYTLSQQSIDLVAKLDRQVAVQAFFNKGSPEEKGFKDLVEQYAEHST
ncbi:MAG TPA: Gldg family protein, partial [Myxococcota bacterium]|nr:Gldg family protein [Myxococcota bacterium]